MAKGQLIGETYQNTIEENRAILSKLRVPNKIENKTSDEWIKLFAKLNNNSNNNDDNINKNNNNNCKNNKTKKDNGKKEKKSDKTSIITRQDQVIVEPIYGPIQGFSSGHWWGIRMDCSRDQVHSPFDKDIQTGPFGVASICTSHLNTTNDIDLGTLLTFTGGEYISGKMDDPLMYNYQHNIPLRLVRSYNLTNEFAPKTGYRYDGLYIVISSWIGVSSNSKKYYKFSLARLNNQEPPPWILPSKRVSQRISSVIRSANAKAGDCGSLRCHMYGCQTQEPEKKRKKIFHDHKTSTALNANNVCLNKSSDVVESTIVMRHVSKKTDTTGAIGGVGHGVNIHSGDLSEQMENLMLPCSQKAPICKLPNTNISIRTELYDSSPNAQQDMKKTTPMIFCRIYKTLKPVPPVRTISNHSTNPVGTINLNVFGPCVKDKMNQDSQIQSGSRIDKVSDVPNVSATTCALKSTRNICEKKIGCNVETNDVSIKNVPMVCNLINRLKLSELNDEDSKLKANNEDNLDKYSPDDLKTSQQAEIINSRRSSSNTSLSSTESLIKKLPEASVAIETMTPEQLLNLIVKKRYNPTGKLLIGSIIGLPTENLVQTESVVDSNSMEKSNTMETRGKIKEILKSNENENKLYESRIKSTVASTKKIGNENIDRRRRLMGLRRTRVAKALVPIDDSNINRNKNSSKRLNKTHSGDKVAQPFSKSTTMKKRELANLVIDANFSTKIRGHTIQTRTMSRRLRSPTIILRKRKEFKGFITNYTRVDLSKTNKRLKSVKKTKMPKTRHVQKKKCDETIDRNTQHDTVKSVGTNMRTIDEEKRKNSIEKRNKMTIKVNPRTIPRPKSRMVDAMIQCTLEKESSTSTKSHCSEQNDKKPMKIECIDLVDDVKSENVSDESLEELNYNNRPILMSSHNTNSLQTNGTNKQKNSKENPSVQSSTNNKNVSINKPLNNLSAFVPVNLPDGDVRVARLRSIGFKPIEPCLLRDNVMTNNRNDCHTTVGDKTKPTVIQRNVDEQYKKYTSEENNVVGYMDHELHYQDIEAEVIGPQKINEIICKRKYTKVRGKKLFKNKPGRRTNRKLQTNSFDEEIDEDNVDEEKSPWLGWNSSRTK
ncbi:hypothetical protein PV327_007208 [Microctonus hyperodae]|uniref:YDG domain-containing protein n=1 Tax=Microctonus hyperodae TaxID=165561 RepID=A0AA39F5W8_MICHY|nr:hypothetical protein PV327_007208 [Microctonus hyperodae]